MSDKWPNVEISDKVHVGNLISGSYLGRSLDTTTGNSGHTRSKRLNGEHTNTDTSDQILSSCIDTHERWIHIQ